MRPVPFPFGRKFAADALVQLKTAVNVSWNPTAVPNSSVMFQLRRADEGDSARASKKTNSGPNTARAASS